jgi:hypothetical protein
MIRRLESGNWLPRWVVFQFESKSPSGGRQLLVNRKADICGAANIEQGLNTLRKNGDQRANLLKNFPQGLKATLILFCLRHE